MKYLVILVVMLSLVGCGQTGNLYLPKSDKTNKECASEPNGEAEDGPEDEADA